MFIQGMKTKSNIVHNLTQIASHTSIEIQL